MCLLLFRMGRGRGRGRRQRGFDDDNGFEAWGGYMNAKKAKLEEQYLKDRGMYRMFQQVLDGIHFNENFKCAKLELSENSSS